MKITLRRVVDGQQGYWSVIELVHTEEEFITHPQFGRVRLTGCEETETRCGNGEGCFAVTETVFPQEPMLVRAMRLKKAGWMIV